MTDITEIYEILKTLYDPEIPVNIVDLGLIYKIEINPEHIYIEMTLTNPACPVVEQFPDVVKTQVENHLSGKTVIVHLVWDPPWTPDRMTEEAKFELGLL